MSLPLACLGQQADLRGQLLQDLDQIAIALAQLRRFQARGQGARSVPTM